MSPPRLCTAFMAVAAAAVAVWPVVAPVTRGVARRHMHSCHQFLQVLDTSVEQQLDELVCRGNALLGEEVLSHLLDATQHKLGQELGRLPCGVKPRMAEGSRYIRSNHGELW